MKKFLILLILPVQFSFAQSEITLEDCYNWAKETYPNMKQSELYTEIAGLNKENINKNYLPTATIIGQATYQSDVTKIDINMPNFNIPSISKDQYKIYLEFQQNIWDGGLSQTQKQMEEAILKTNLNQIEIELFGIKEKINKAWFSALAAQINIEILNTQKFVLQEKIKMLESGVKNGVAEESGLNSLQAELLNNDQAILEVETGYQVSLKILSILTGKNLDESVKLISSETILEHNDILNRPELELFTSQAENLDVNGKLLDNQRNPKIYGFGQAGYGRPGLNMLSDDFDPYYLIGLGISWNVLDWKNTNRQKQIIEIQKKIIDTKQETFEQDIEILLEQQLTIIQKTEMLIESDKQIITLRQKIVDASASKLENGTITPSDYIADLNAATVSKLKLETHRLQLEEAIVKYNTIKGI